MDSKGIQEKFKALFAWTVSPLRGPADRLSARWEHSFLWPVLACRPVLFSFSTERLSIWFAPPRRSPGRLDVAALAARFAASAASRAPRLLRWWSVVRERRRRAA
jgi:hypothetical protein